MLKSLKLCIMNTQCLKYIPEIRDDRHCSNQQDGRRCGAPGLDRCDGVTGTHQKLGQLLLVDAKLFPCLAKDGCYDDLAAVFGFWS